MNPIQYSQYNQYLIKSLLNNLYFTFDKKGSLKYTKEINDKEYFWGILSLDQVVNFNQNYSLRFGEFLQISTIKSQNQCQLLCKQPLLIQQPNTLIISAQTFQRLKDNLVQNQPCVFLNSETNLYLTINNDKITFQEKPTPGSYFQIIPLYEQELSPNRPLIQFQYEYEIRNYVTGYSLNIYIHPLTFQNLALGAIRSNKKCEIWNLTKTHNFDNKFQILNLFYEKYIHTEDQKIVNLIKKNPLNVNWEFLTIDGKELSYGVPFLIQQSFTKYFLTMNVLNLKEPQNYQQCVYQSEILKPTSLWIIFKHYI
ncbi:unnamed protein product [Paramecium pentaurelia]|uniref:Uncharacterized protein n=1 Tax=Paramecium pentaurelia TaxID=43138 RepID=A0A8S1V5X1_9CILI|nr:unnamed protein product [Paramecium pentaurelia]